MMYNKVLKVGTLLWIWFFNFLQILDILLTGLPGMSCELSLFLPNFYLHLPCSIANFYIVMNVIFAIFTLATILINNPYSKYICLVYFLAFPFYFYWIGGTFLTALWMLFSKKEGEPIFTKKDYLAITLAILVVTIWALLLASSFYFTAIA